MPALAGVHAHAALAQFLRRADHHDVIPRRDPGVPARADHHVAAGGGDDGDRRQRSVQLTQAGRFGATVTGGETFSGQPDLLHARPQAASTTDGADSPATSSTATRPGPAPGPRRVPQLRDHPHVLAELAGQQRRLQRVQVIFAAQTTAAAPASPAPVRVSATRSSRRCAARPSW